MSISGNSAATILLVDDVEEVRDGIEQMLQADGYRVDPARSEERAVESAQRDPPKLILVNLAGPPHAVIASARRIRERGQLDHSVPIVLFCIEAVAEGAEVDFGDNVYVIRPDNFNQLREFLSSLLQAEPAQT
jgi:DNA-binding response OmpR family regulator